MPANDVFQAYVFSKLHFTALADAGTAKLEAGNVSNLDEKENVL